jgi:hypothetical protein
MFGTIMQKCGCQAFEEWDLTWDNFIAEEQAKYSF